MLKSVSHNHSSKTKSTALSRTPQQTFWKHLARHASWEVLEYSRSRLGGGGWGCQEISRKRVAHTFPPQAGATLQPFYLVFQLIIISDLGEREQFGCCRSFSRLLWDTKPSIRLIILVWVDMNACERITMTIYLYSPSANQVTTCLAQSTLRKKSTAWIYLRAWIPELCWKWNLVTCKWWRNGLRP
jgi:hypothetical protein